MLGQVLWTPKTCFPLSCANKLVLLYLVFGVESAGGEYCSVCVSRVHLDPLSEALLRPLASHNYC